MIPDLENVETILNSEITIEEVKKAAQLLKNGKSPGVDNILNEYIKYSLGVAGDLYVSLFNMVFKSGIIRTCWSAGTICPIYKQKGKTTEPENYRGITLLSCLGKLFTSVLNNRLNDFTSANNIINVNQAGFRKGFATTDHIFTIKCLIDLYLSKGMKLYCAFIDYKQAFDTVWRAGLWRKIIQYGINGPFLRTVQSLYNAAKSCVTVNGQFSDYFSCSIGVRQGENLSPMLFSLYLNDLEDFLLGEGFEGLKHLHTYSNCSYLKQTGHLLKLLVLLYADDTALVSDSAEGLQKGLDALASYCTTWKLQVNVSKTKVMIFERGKSKTNKPSFRYANKEVEIVNSYKYLGVTFSWNGHFNTAIRCIKDQGSRAMYSLLRRGRKLGLPKDIMFDLFDKMITPILLYGCEVWGCYSMKGIEIVHKKFCKLVMGMPKRTPSKTVYSETKRKPLEIEVKSRMVSFWLKTATNQEFKWNHILMNVLFDHIANNYSLSPWCSFVSDILIKNGLGYILIQPGVYSIPYVRSILRQRLNDQWQQENEAIY